MTQDERYFRQIFTGELAREQSRKLQKDQGSSDYQLEDKKYKNFFHTPYYAIDLNHDGKPESLLYIKKDSEDWIEIFQNDQGIKKKIYSYRFETKGYNSELFKIEFKKVSSNTSVLVFYFFEGVSHYTEMQATSRIYLITIDNDNLETLAAFKGPSFVEEKRLLKGHYHFKTYQTYFKDLNGDQIKEFVVKFHNTNQVYFYKGSGKWISF